MIYMILAMSCCRVEEPVHQNTIAPSIPFSHMLVLGNSIFNPTVAQPYDSHHETCFPVLGHQRTYVNPSPGLTSCIFDWPILVL
jgi:hypothetical protein